MVRRDVVLAVVVVAILAASGGYYFVNASGSSSGNTTTVTIIGSTPGLYGQNATTNPDAFIPNNLTVTQGTHVVLVFENEDDGPHQLVIPGLNVNTQIVQGGQTVRVNFFANKAGVYAWDQPAGACNAGGLTPQQGGCTGEQLTNGNLTVIAP
ncbi:MAG TPA: cupredoxin domain-containing protein [Nitrososphaerales archaeon]|nr:cupredoxin domain-containing protein [Nitrososphaerales archaeon]